MLKTLQTHSSQAAGQGFDLPGVAPARAWAASHCADFVSASALSGEGADAALAALVRTAAVGGLVSPAAAV